MNSFYKTRAHQMLAFEREVKAGKTSLREALKWAAICGAEEERSRILRIVDSQIPFPENNRIFGLIMSRTVEEVLGYEPIKKKSGNK
jgi:hypothetical protein